MYVGYDAIASTAPSRGSSATIAPPFACPLVVLVGELDAVAERPLGGPLEADVERQADGVARLRRSPLREGALRPPERVDAELRRARAAAQVRVERRLDAGLADLVAAA